MIISRNKFDRIVIKRVNEALREERQQIVVNDLLNKYETRLQLLTERVEKLEKLENDFRRHSNEIEYLYRNKQDKDIPKTIGYTTTA